MRVIILTDALFASRERGLLQRLQVGLADEGVRVLHAVPDDAAGSPGGEVLSRVITYAPRTLAFTLAWAARRLAERISQTDRNEDGGATIIHAFGGSVWKLGSRVAAELGGSVALEVWRAGLIGRAREWRGDGPAPVFIAPDPAVERALTEGGAALTVRGAPWGVYAPESTRTVLAPGRAPAVMLVGSGNDTPAFVAALEGVARVANRRENLLVFCDAIAARKTGLWAHARRLGMLDRLSLIEELEARRELVLSGDVLLQPEAAGEQRSIVLEAFAAGVPVIAGADPFVSALVDGRTCRLVDPRRAAPWAAVLGEFLDQPARAASLAALAHEFVARQRRASDHVRAVLGAYEWMASPGAIPFARASVR